MIKHVDLAAVAAHLHGGNCSPQRSTQVAIPKNLLTTDKRNKEVSDFFCLWSQKFREVVQGGV